ncbi:mitochondrial import inner membrane translocase subunit Tim9 [Carex littledalei]|uniref:Mitochondrial import inner membrane translocase subunit n=1 Tax=Carex littledalei TaxID=544730 RepID=A0A833VPR5_9POAL|nr:mitochondrial import inner membrane translocase subunit Tim9 [Carex littledalei]
MDWSNMDLMESLPEEDRARMSAIIDQLQTRDALRIYNSLVQRCFSDCVNSFGRKALGKQEELCVRLSPSSIASLSSIRSETGALLINLSVPQRSDLSHALNYDT